MDTTGMNVKLPKTILVETTLSLITLSKEMKKDDIKRANGNLSSLKS